MTPNRILNFHGIGAPSRVLDPGEAPFWVPESTFEAICSAVASRPDRNAILITFDDGNLSDIAIAAPVLTRLGLPAIFFPLAGRLDAAGSLRRTDLPALRAAGFAIGSHGFDHVDWRRLDGSGRTREFVDARRVLEEAAGAGITDVAIPFGLYNRSVITALRSLNYASIHTSDRGPAGDGPVLSRLSVRDDMGLEDIMAFLDGIEPPGRRLRRMLSTARRRLL